VIGEPVVRVRKGASPGNDRYGNPLPGTDVETTLTGAAFDPGGTLEPVEIGRTQVVTTPKVYFRDYAPDVLSTDLLRVRGLLYQVQGRPAKWVSPYTTRTAGLVVELKLAEG
jgi:hypothetical protein